MVAAAALILAEVFYFRFHTYFLGTQVNESLPMSDSDVSTQPQSVVMETMETVAEGRFVEVDAIHKGSGTAKILTQNNTSYLRLEDFQVTNGPDLFVYLSESKTPGNTLASLGNYVNLGVLKGNSGNQNYEIPAEFSGYRTTVIWCQQFGVLFSFAVME